MNEIPLLALNLEMAAKAISVSRPTMRNIARRSDFPAFREGARWIIPVDAFRQWLNAKAASDQKFDENHKSSF